MDSGNLYYCKRIKCQVTAEKSNDVTGRVFVDCGYYTYTNLGQFENPCKKDYPHFKKCHPAEKEQQAEKEKSKLAFG